MGIPEDRELDTTMDKILASSCRFGTPRASGPGFNQFPFLERIAKKTEVTPESNPSAPEPKPRRKPSSTLIKQPCNTCIGSEEAPRRESTPEPIWPKSLEMYRSCSRMLWILPRSDRGVAMPELFTR